MLTLIVAGLAIALIAFGAIAYFRAQTHEIGDPKNYVVTEQRWMPSEIANAELIHSEKQLYATINGVSVPVRPDQVYRTLKGKVIPIDTKTRNTGKVYPYDEIELSIQRLGLSESHVHTVRGSVANHGYIRIKDKSGRRRPEYHKVQLWTRDRIEALYRRYQGIISGRIQPQSQTNKNACSGCAYRSRCSRAL